MTQALRNLFFLCPCMHLSDLKTKIPEPFYIVLEKTKLDELRPAQEKAINQGLLQRKSLLVCTPTGSGKTLVAELAIVSSIINRVGKGIYIAPLKSLATEKYKQFKQRYGHLFSITLSIGDMDDPEPYLAEKDLIITTSEKLDSLIRHGAPWLKDVAVVVVDEIHLLNDHSRGPTLEIIITLLRQLLKNIQIIGLSATIGNPQELADWLNAELVMDTWRPVELKKGILLQGKVEFY